VNLSAAYDSKVDTEHRHSFARLAHADMRSHPGRDFVAIDELIFDDEGVLAVIEDLWKLMMLFRNSARSRVPAAV